jgi:hypothetical protein
MLSNAKGVLIFGVPGLIRFLRPVLNATVRIGILRGRNRNEMVLLGNRRRRICSRNISNTPVGNECATCWIKWCYVE